MPVRITIPKAILMFSGTPNSMALRPTWSSFKVCSEMTTGWIASGSEAAILISGHTKKELLVGHYSVDLDVPENIGTAVGISSITCIQPKLLLLPVLRPSLEPYYNFRFRGHRT